jgi:hypothetical protein
MPFSIEDFPIEVNQPKIDVILPVGTHVLELVVEDSAGFKSAPDRVTITVEKEKYPEPAVTGIEPVFGPRGQTIEVMIYGQNLSEAYEVKFLRGTVEDLRLEATPLPGATDTELPVSLRIKGNAAYGECNYEVSTPGGIAQNPPDATFLVVGLPEITDVDPLYAHQGTDWEAVALITGRHLMVPGQPLSAHKVEFMHEPGPNREVLARLTDKCSPEQLEVEIKVGDEADLGEHRLSVTTPAGTAEAPADKVFEVRGPVEAQEDES